MATIEEQKKQIAAFKKVFQNPPNVPVTQSQKRFPRSALVKGPVWIAQDDIKVAGEDDVKNNLFEVIDFATAEPIVLPSPAEISADHVHVEWIGARPGADRDAKQPAEMLVSDVFEKLQSDMRNDFTILFAHGGAFYLGNSVSARATTTRLARLTRARVVSVDYRLAPQAQFPSQLLDLLLTYLALLYPPPGSKHKAIPATKIVLAGESSGGGLCLALIQYIIQLQRMQKTKTPTIRFAGRDVDVPMPAGITVLSAEADKSFGLPSWLANADTDILGVIQPVNAHTQVPGEAWPSNPPRHDVYCHASAYLYPLASPCVATSWEGAPPMWFAYGEERCIDGGKMIASTAAKQKVDVRFLEYAGMPHIFSILFAKFKQSQDCMTEWAGACLAMAEGRGISPGAKRILSTKEPADSSVDMDVKKLFKISREEAMGMIRAATAARRVYDGKSASRSSL